MKMVIGLGNPGKKYAGTKHNVGFMVVDELARHLNLHLNKLEHDAVTASTRIGGERVLLAEPQTFMNESGRAVKQLMHFYKLVPEDIIVVQDDLDMPVGKLRLRAKGSAGGHNGIKDIISNIGTSDFARVKIGIAHPTQTTVVDWVLTPFTGDNAAVVGQAQDLAVSLLYDWLRGEELPELMNKYN
ncbi:aminoacyl-tRNA hydrolase [Lacticaseibacillus thailandensis]|nr:aminoacyl-tRNA hydrolase [Lacticaseibacillus thailandensis]